MMEKIFGQKEKFAIEIKVADKIIKSNLRIWTNNTQLGYFKKSGDLIYSIRNLKKLLFKRNNLYESIFSKMTPEDIFEWVRGKELVDNFTKENTIEFHRRREHTIFWGDQLDEFSTVCYYKNNTFYWIIYDVKKKAVLTFSSQETEVVPVIEEYINWYEGLYGKVKVNYSTYLSKN